MYRVTVEEIVPAAIAAQDQSALLVKRYTQEVDLLDLNAVIAAVNRKPRKPRTVKVKA